MPKNKSSPGEKADFFAFPSRFTILGQVRKNTIPIYLPTKRPRIGTIMKNHIQSSSGLSKAALFVCSESDTSLKNYIKKSGQGVHNLFIHAFVVPRQQDKVPRQPKQLPED